MQWFNNNGVNVDNCHRYKIVQISKMTSKTRCCRKVHGSSILIKHGPHQGGSLSLNLTYYWDQILNFSGDGFIWRPRYMMSIKDKLLTISLYELLRGWIDTYTCQLSVSSNQLEAEARWPLHLSQVGRLEIYICEGKIESEEHFGLVQCPPSFNKWWGRLTNDTLAKSCWSFKTIGNQPLI